MVVTAVSVVLYLGLIAVSAPDVENLYIMRPAYLAITGYLVGYLGQQRLMLEDKIRGLEAGAQREAIARSLHDNYVQALSGVNLQIGICRELMRRGRGEEASDQLADLQACVKREHDGLRTYINSLLDREAERSVPVPGDATRFSVTASFSGSHFLVEHVLQIMLEGSRNVSRHARASGAAIDATTTDFGVRITLDDDGVGFRGDAGIPWSIASRVTECDGRLEVNANGRRGAHLLIELPEA
jgi:two-component system sensor histidine kinase DesK